MNLKKVALAVVAAAGIASSANAATVMFQAPGPGLQPTEINQVLSLGLFDTNLGTLIGATLTIDSAAETTIILTNNAAQNQNVSATGNVDILVSSSVGALSALLVNPIETLMMPTGIQNIAGGGGVFNSGLLTDSGTDILNVLAAGGALSAAGGGNFSLTCDSLSGLTLQGGGGQVGANQTTRAGCGAKIVYEFRENTNVPEPATLGLLGLVLGGMGLAGRRARAA